MLFKHIVQRGPCQGAIRPLLWDKKPPGRLPQNSNNISQKYLNALMTLPNYVCTQNLDEYMISITMTSTLCIMAMMCAANVGAAVRSPGNRGYEGVVSLLPTVTAPFYVGAVEKRHQPTMQLLYSRFYTKYWFA